MSICIRDLSDEYIVCITKILARRPEYGIAIPSKRWLLRQQEKIEQLPKDLLRPSNPFKRLAMKIAVTLDSDIMDPQAVLCETHSSLNPFLIRRLFMAVAYEVTVHADALRSWPDRTSVPELSAFVGRMDSIAALWTEPRLFRKIYGIAPFDSHQIYVKSGCEACCLAAIGASGRVLADLRAGLIDRIERRSNPEHRRSEKTPRLYRIIEAWIDHLKKHGEERSRSNECRDWSEDMLTQLRVARPQIRTWRSEQKRIHAKLRASRRPVYAELRRTNTGAKITPLPANAGHRRGTRHGIPVALVNVEGAEAQRRAAMSRDADASGSIYRADSLCGFSEVHKQQQAAYDLPAHARPNAPEPVRMSGPSNGEPTQSFIHRFEQEVSLDNDNGDFNDYEEPGLDERDPQQEERSRVKVHDWYAHRLTESQEGLSPDDQNSILSMVHPAFREGADVAQSALPQPLRFKKDCEPQVRISGARRDPLPSTAWTDATVYTVDPSSIQPNLRDAPPVPRVASKYDNQRQPSSGGDRSSRAPFTPPLGTPRESPVNQNSHQSTIYFPDGADNDGSKLDPSSKNFKNVSLNWPAPPQAPPPAPKNKPNAKRFLFHDSDVGSNLSTHQRAYVKDRRRMKEYPPEMNPFMEARSNDGGARTPLSPRIIHGSRTATPSSPATAQPQAFHPTHDRQNMTSGSKAMSDVPSLDYSHGSTVDESEVYRGNGTGPRPRPAAAEEERWRESFEIRDDATNLDPIHPDDSASNVLWNRRDNASSVTQLRTFMDKM
ncbi:hypothetical protein F5Y19DRAFT_178810 [Xylariaceae sp. FL1651]|nr:hypothetical protein F5Y19DRAFT_178810 [Xylariaceae sp. FL1651]